MILKLNNRFLYKPNELFVCKFVCAFFEEKEISNIHNWVFMEPGEHLICLDRFLDKKSGNFLISFYNIEQNRIVCSSEKFLKVDKISDKAYLEKLI